MLPSWILSNSEHLSNDDRPINMQCYKILMKSNIIGLKIWKCSEDMIYKQRYAYCRKPRLEVLTYCSVRIYCSTIWSHQSVTLRRDPASRTLKLQTLKSLNKLYEFLLKLCYDVTNDKHDKDSKTFCQEWLTDLTLCSLPTKILYMKIQKVKLAFLKLFIHNEISIPEYSF